MMRKTAFLCFAFLASVHAWAEAPLTRSIDANGRALLGSAFGQTLYVFDPDQGAHKPSCVGNCAEAWPPYLISGPEAATLQGPFSPVTRENGRIQLAYEGRPVYLFHLDRAAGEMKGDGLGGVWHVIDAR